MFKKVLILRGPSGSGKSTYAKTLKGAKICSADDFFGGSDGYVRDFDVTLLPQAHALCMKRFLACLIDEHPLVVVDNMHTETWEWINYYNAATLAGYTVEVVEFMPKTIEELKIIAKRNKHFVPAGVVAQKAMMFQPFAGATQRLIIDKEKVNW